VRVVVGEDSLLTREGIVRLLQDAGYTVVGQGGDLPSVMQAVELTSPDLVVVDIRMPPTFTDEGLTAARAIREHRPDMGVLVLSQYVEPTYALRLLEEHPGGVGYLLKEKVFDVAVLVDALRRIADDETVVDPSIVSRLFGRHRRDDPLDRLTEREREVLGLIAQGLSNVAIARRLFITERTVQAHTTQIFIKLKLPADADSHRRVLAVVAYLQHGGENATP
jgi:DNA-binding NarL/FixJ family response regulator